jgi:hypothetical protein
MVTTVKAPSTALSMDTDTPSFCDGASTSATAEILHDWRAPGLGLETVHGLNAVAPTPDRQSRLLPVRNNAPVCNVLTTPLPSRAGCATPAIFMALEQQVCSVAQHAASRHLCAPLIVYQS